VRYEIYLDGPGPYGHPATCDNEAYADLIVRVVNAHAELVAALESAPNPPLHRPGCSCDPCDAAHHAWKRWHVARAAALAKIRGEA
jgi:hypothetical protein